MATRSAPPAIRISRIRSKSPPSSPTCISTRRRSPSRCCTTRSRTPTPRAHEIDELFGPEIGKLVEGLTKLKKLDLVSKKAEQAENLRKLLLAISEDVRVLLVKLADRLHNMRTLDHVPADKRLRIAEETMEIYAPLAGRMGMQDMREELEELAFRHINPGSLPDGHRAAGRDLRAQSTGSIGEIEKALSALFEKHGIKADGQGPPEEALVGVPQDGGEGAVLRAALRHLRLPRHRRHDRGLLPRARRHPHDLVDGAGPLQGLHLDAEAERLPLDPHHDRRAVAPARRAADPHPRDEQDRRIRRRRALRSTRTAPASRTAPATQISKDTNAYAWLRRTIEQLAEGDNPEDFLENTKLELFQDQVFCFTPKGRLIALPRGATPIDFAYAVHTDVGDTCVGAKVNGRIMPLMTELKNGDEVEIIRSKAQVPPAAWESIVVTGKARAAIRRATRNAIRKQYSGLGARILERAFERAGKTFSKDEPEGGAARGWRARMSRTCWPPSAAARSRSTDVMRAVFPDYKDERVTQPPKPREEGWFNLRNAAGMLFQIPGRASRKERQEDKERRAADPRRRAATCRCASRPRARCRATASSASCSPARASPSIRSSRRRCTAFDDQPERWIDVRWDIDESNKERFPARISVTAINAPGSLAEIAQIIAVNDANIHTLSMVAHGAGFHRDADRPRSLGPEAPEPAAVAVEGQVLRSSDVRSA